MADANNAYESKYMSWLTEKAPPERLSELYATYKNIEDECKKARVIKSSLFECLNIVSIHKIKVTVEGSRLYRFFHRKESGKTAEAIRYMLQYVQEEEAASRRELDSAAAAMSETPGSETPYASGQDQTPAPSSDFEESKDDIAADARDTSDDNEHPPVTAEPSPEERVKDALREESSNNLYGATPYYLAKSAGLGVAEVRKMLTAAPWAKKLYGNYIFCEPETETVSDVPVVHPGQVEATPNAEQQIRPAAPDLPDGTLSVNYLSVEGLAFTKPFMMSYFDDRFSVRSWKDALVLACRLLIDDYPDAFAKLREQGALPGAHSVWIVKESSAGKLRAPKEIIPDYYIETNRSAKEIVKIIRTLLDICRVDCDNMVIYYRRLAESPTGTSAETTADEPLEDAQPQPATRELTPELAQLLAGDDFEPLRKKLGEEGVLTIEQFRSVQPWAFMNEHRLYRLPQRQEIFSEIKKRIQAIPWQGHKDSVDWILSQLENRNLTYLDKRKWNGRLWIVGGHELDGFIQECIAHGYSMTFKPDGNKDFPDKPVWWTKSSPVPQILTSIPLENTEPVQTSLGAFRAFLVHDQHLAARTAGNYCTSIRMIEEYIQRNQLNITILNATTNNIQANVDFLMARPDFVEINNERHHQFSAALTQYVEHLTSIEPKADKPVARHNMTIKDVVIKVLSEAPEPLTMPEIMRRIEECGLYTFNSSNPFLILYQGIRRYCKGMKAPNHSPVDVFDRFTDADGQVRYMLIGEKQTQAGETVAEIPPVDDRWVPILRASFPDGYILDDFLSQFQASAFWQELYDETCPIEGEAIDAAFKAIGTIMDGRVFAKNNDDNQLINEICTEIKSILSEYSNVYRSCIYERYRDRLASAAIYTESVMTQQLLDAAKGSFISTYQVFSLSGQETSVVQDCRKVLRKHGGAMNVSVVAKELWFIPYGLVYHSLSADDEALNIGNGVWMLVDHFPLTREEATTVGDMLDECFLTNDFVLESDLIPLLQEHLPSIADNLSGLHFIAIFNILSYYLKERFSFSKAIIAPKGAKTDFRDLFRGYAREHEKFTLDELSAFASDLKVPIYWESTFSGGAVRVSRTEFIHRSLIEFNVEAADTVLESFCTDDYLPLQEVSSAMMMHLPPCGYPWNGYLLLSYIYGFSKVFRLSYNSLGKTGFYGAMVRRSCEKIASYEQLVEQVLADDPTWQTEDEALSVLVNRGLQAQKRLKGIVQIVAKARQKKLSKDGM